MPHTTKSWKPLCKCLGKVCSDFPQVPLYVFVAGAVALAPRRRSLVALSTQKSVTRQGLVHVRAQAVDHVL